MNSPIRIENFTPDHFARLRLRKEDATDLAGLDSKSLFSSWQGGRTLFQENDPVMIYGYWANSGTAGIWAVTSPLLRRYPLLVTRLALNGLDALFRCGNHRVETYCHSRNGRSFAWLTRSLGFRVEGLMRRSGPNRQDRYLLALLDEDWAGRSGLGQTKTAIGELEE